VQAPPADRDDQSFLLIEPQRRAGTPERRLTSVISTSSPLDLKST
jgi:hypothetical protein